MKFSFLLLLLSLKQKNRRLTSSSSKVHSSSLKAPTENFWAKIWDRGTDDDFLAVVALPKAAFIRLLNVFSRFFEVKSGKYMNKDNMQF
jgi:hypothetical protein